jgi:hypothetical protein
MAEKIRMWLRAFATENISRTGIDWHLRSCLHSGSVQALDAFCMETIGRLSARETPARQDWSFQ